jgi:hypothetical protein
LVIIFTSGLEELGGGFFVVGVLVKDRRADGIEIVGYSDEASEVNTSLDFVVGGLDALTVGLEDGSEVVGRSVGVVGWNPLGTYVGEVVVGKIEGNKLLGAFVEVLVIIFTSGLEELGGDFFVVGAKRDISYLPYITIVQCLSIS